ncbi:MAG: hypothetical protein V7731_16430 [Amphritea sp.]
MTSFFKQVLKGLDHESLTPLMIERKQPFGECLVGGGTWDDKSVISISVCFQGEGV